MDKKQRILLTMLELCSKKGIHETPISLVAKEADVAVGTIYHYYKTKEDIIRDLYKLIVKDLSAILFIGVEEKSDFKAQFTQIWRNFHNYFVSNPSAFYFMEIVALPPIINNDEVRKNSIYYTDITSFIRGGVDSGILKPYNVKLLMQITFGNFITSVRLRIRKTLPMEQKQLDAAINMAWDAIRRTDN